MPPYKKRIAIIGATSAIAEHCARLWVKDAEARVILVGRDQARTERVAADLRIRSPRSLIHALQTDFTDPLSIHRLAEEIFKDGPIDIVLIAHGMLPDQALCQRDLGACSNAMIVNGISPALFAEAFAGHMEKAGHGTLAIFGSPAGDRGRKSNYIYGAAKGLAARYAEGLQHRLANTGVRVVLIKPGPTATPMTAGMKRTPAKLADAGEVAQVIVNGVNKGRPVVYAPAKWALIMMIIRHLPRFVFNRMDI